MYVTEWGAAPLPREGSGAGGGRPPHALVVGHGGAACGLVHRTGGACEPWCVRLPREEAEATAREAGAAEVTPLALFRVIFALRDTQAGASAGAGCGDGGVGVGGAEDSDSDEEDEDVCLC